MTQRNNDETQEWLDALSSLVKYEGIDRAREIVEQLLVQATGLGIQSAGALHTPYRNTINVSDEIKHPGDLEIEKRLLAWLRWNAMAIVVRAVKKNSSIGGHIATYASAAVLYEIGYNHFFHAATADHGGDLVYVQGHSSPGIYARAFLEGRLSEEQLDLFRQEAGGKGLASYPHPWTMPDFWQFATVSMGLGPIQAIYQARFLKYLQFRGFAKTDNRKVWAFLGDGETDEPESLGAISLGGRENLDNLIFVINCNLQRLDGPVRGNGSIIQELESMFRGAHWNVIKVIWGHGWDALFAKDKSGLLLKRMEECVDGEYQAFKAHDGAYIREHFFGKYPELLELVKDLSDDEIYHLQRGGHDLQKVYAAFAAAVAHKGQPTVILAKTVKGYGMGDAGESQNITHQKKKLDEDDLLAYAKRFHLPFSDEEAKKVPYYKPAPDSPEMKYLHERRKALGGYLPSRQTQGTALIVPALSVFDQSLQSSGDREISTTMAFVRCLSALLKDVNLSKRLVPIVPDESRTFGMEGLFRQIGIYSPHGQLYTPEDKKQLMYYKEATDGQIFEEGLTEAGAFSTWIAAGTSYSNSNCPMIPIYIYYSMFGFQRTGDLAWAAGDMQARGFLFGAVSGRTTLEGEGLQHCDGQNHLYAATIPNCIAYDPTYGYELAVIFHEGLKRMYEKQENVFYYLSIMNENYLHPAMPEGVEEGIIKGMYLLKASKQDSKHRVQLLGSGAILREVEAAAEMLANDFKVSADVWSVTSFTELGREGLNVARDNLLNPTAKPKKSYVETCLEGRGPVVAATDYMKAYADQIRQFVPGVYSVLGTDGFGLSDIRSAMREYFEVDRHFVVLAALSALGLHTEAARAIELYKINTGKKNPASIHQ